MLEMLSFTWNVLLLLKCFCVRPEGAVCWNWSNCRLRLGKREGQCCLQILHLYFDNSVCSLRNDFFFLYNRRFMSLSYMLQKGKIYVEKIAKLFSPIFKILWQHRKVYGAKVKRKKTCHERQSTFLICYKAAWCYKYTYLQYSRHSNLKLNLYWLLWKKIFSRLIFLYQYQCILFYSTILGLGLHKQYIIVYL